MTARRDFFSRQAEGCDGRSPFYAALCRRLAEEPPVDGLVGEWTWDVPLRLLGGLHNLVLRGQASWSDVPGALVEHGGFLRGFVAEQGVQTNEVQRSWFLLPCFLDVARRTGAELFDLIELGPSAGLNLVWDRYRYRYAAGGWGPADARLELAGEERRRVPGELLGLAPRVRSRVGVNRKPADVTTEEGALLLKSFVWPDQTWRLELLDRAIEELRRDPPQLVRGDFVEELPKLLDRRREDALTVVFQTAATGYISAEQRDRLRDALERAGRDGPLAFVATSRPANRTNHYYALTARVWPEARRHEVAYADFHGAWLDWL